MKRINIPITEKRITQDNTSTKEEYSTSNSHSLKDILKFNEGELRSSITIDNLYKKLSDDWRALSRTEIMYLYNLYNVRLLCDMQSKYDYDKNEFKKSCYKSNFYPSVDDITGLWIYSEAETYSLSSIIKFLHNHPYIIRRHLANFYECSPNAIAMNEQVFKLNPEKYVCLLDDLNIPESEVEVSYPNLKFVSGNVFLGFCKNASNIPNLQYIGGNAYFGYLENTVGLENLIAVGGQLHLSMATDVSNLYSLTSVGDIFSISNATSAQFALYNLCFIGGSACLDNLKDLEALENLRCVLKDIYIPGNKSLDDLKSLKYVGGDIYQGKVKTKKKLK